jgi:hypothetical protein
MTRVKLSTIILTFLILTSCSEKSTTDPIDAYTYWSGTKPPKDLELIQAKYWQSSHWTKEYILYLKLKPTDEWWTEFIKQNNLTLDEGEWKTPTDSPDWFRLPENVTLYKPLNDFYDKRVFKDNETGDCFIYDIQL